MKQQEYANTPNDVLFKIIKNGSRKEENAAMKELRERFYSMSQEEQTQLILHYLGRQKSHRQWAYPYLLDMWDERYAPVVEVLWNEYHEKKCAWSIIMHFPLSFVKEHKEELSIGSNRPFVERRLCEDDTYEIDETKLTPYECVWVYSVTGRKISDEKAMQLLVDNVRRACEMKYIIGRKNLENFSLDMQKIMYHLEKMDKFDVTYRFRTWFEPIIDNVSNYMLQYLQEKEVELHC